MSASRRAPSSSTSRASILSPSLIDRSRAARRQAQRSNDGHSYDEGIARNVLPSLANVFVSRWVQRTRMSRAVVSVRKWSSLEMRSSGYVLFAVDDLHRVDFTREQRCHAARVGREIVGLRERAPTSLEVLGLTRVERPLQRILNLGLSPPYEVAVVEVGRNECFCFAVVHRHHLLSPRCGPAPICTRSRVMESQRSRISSSTSPPSLSPSSSRRR